MLFTALRDFFKEFCFLILGAKNPDSGCATFPGAGETLPRPCSQNVRSLRGLTYLGFREGCLCDALPLPLTLSRDPRPLTNVYSPSSQAGKRSRNFTNQRQRWSRRTFQNHKPLTSVGQVPSSAKPSLRGKAVVSIALLAEFQVCKNVVGMLVQGGLVTWVTICSPARPERTVLQPSSLKTEDPSGLSGDRILTH